MEVYVPIDNAVPASKYTAKCLPAEGDNALTVTVRHPSFTREYQKTDCILGTVYQDQAYFVVRRERSGYPDLLAKPLTVHLACGEDRVSQPIEEIEERYRFEPLYRNPEIYPVTLYSNQNVALFTVPDVQDPFDSGRPDASTISGQVRCSVVGAVYGVNPIPGGDSGLPAYDADSVVGQDKLTATVTVSEHQPGKTLHGLMRGVLDMSLDDRIEKNGSALYYLYFLGWYTGLIHMPYFSIQDLLSSLPYTVPDPDGEGRSDNASVLHALNNREKLRRYQSLASLFVDESDDRFTIDHFGFFTPDEARNAYRNNYGDRSDTYFSRALGVFLQALPPEYRRQ